MSAVTDTGAEREIDLLGLGRSLVLRWWILAAGLVVGVLFGALYSLSGGRTYTATALIAPGQAFNPSGSTPVLTYLTSESAISELATQTATLAEVAAKTGIGIGQLRGQVRISAVNQATGTTSNRNAVLVDVTVRQSKPKRAEDAANALASVIQEKTTSHYVKQSFAIYEQRLANFKARVTTLDRRIATLNEVLAKSTGLQPFDKLVLVSELDQAEAALGSTLDSQTSTQQQLTLAQSVEQTQVIQQAKAQKTAARSRRTSILVGALIGLIAGAIVAIVIDARARRASS
jgi:capsular polysaccharide biosynthesis protein